MNDTPSIWQWATAMLRLFANPLTDAVARGPDHVAALVEEAIGAPDATATARVEAFASAVGSLATIDASSVRSPSDLRTVTAAILNAWDGLVGTVPAAS